MSFRASVFGSEGLQRDGDPDQTPGSSARTGASPFRSTSRPSRFWIFQIQAGLTATVGIALVGQPHGNGFQLTPAPLAAVGAHLWGGVNLGIASGGVDVSMDFIRAKFPLDIDGDVRPRTRPRRPARRCSTPRSTARSSSRRAAGRSIWSPASAPARSASRRGGTSPSGRASIWGPSSSRRRSRSTVVDAEVRSAGGGLHEAAERDDHPPEAHDGSRGHRQVRG